jgi:hypothetical protein
MTGEFAKVKRTITITEDEMKLYEDNSVCREACEKIIEKVVFHFETSEKARRAWWAALGEKYGLDHKTEIGVLTHATRVFEVFDAEDHRFGQEFGKLRDRVRLENFYKEKFGLSTSEPK